ncbi:MAG: amino acid ABC transporter substrate-binding protein [Clostridiales bacterium]|nr:amino acid ABC transporter substrate-binding protein [Clostridiales bacterium]
MKNIKRLLALCLALCMVMGLAACSGGNSAVSAIKDKGTMTIALESGFAPFEYAEGENIVGIDIDIAKYIADKWDVELEVQDMNFDTALASVSTGAADLGLSGISKTEERDKNMDFSNPYFESNQLIVVKEGSGIKSKDDLVGKKVGAQGGTTGETLAQEFLGEDNVASYDKYAVAVQDLINGQIEAIVMDAYPAQAAVKANGGKIVALEEALGKDSYCIAVKEGNSDLVEALNEILKEMNDNGEMKKIVDKYEAILQEG